MQGWLRIRPGVVCCVPITTILPLTCSEPHVPDRGRWRAAPGLQDERRRRHGVCSEAGRVTGGGRQASNKGWWLLPLTDSRDTLPHKRALTLTFSSAWIPFASLQADVIKKAPNKRSKADGERPTQTRRGAGGGGGERNASRRSKAGGAGAALADAEPVVDGIFRAVPGGASAGSPTAGVSCSKTGRWSVTLSLSGELYRAYFDTQEDALEAFNASGSAASA
jgi:hypothetical protein